MSDLEILGELEKEIDYKLVKLDGNFFKLWERETDVKRKNEIVCDEISYKSKNYVLDYNGNLVGLFINDMGINKIPQQVLQFKNLQILSLLNNKLSKLPKEISELKSLQSLDLSFNQLSELPKEISELKRLQELSLRYNKLSEIGKLKNLQTLDLSSNQLSELPKKIGELKSLQTLDLSYNLLSELPNEIGELKSLQLLDLGYNKFSEFPKEIGELKGLQILDLSDNQLSELPKEIGELQSLQYLNLRLNQLSKFPKEVNKLKNLQTLDLRLNQLSELSKEIGKLKSLQTLDLRHNQLTELSKEIGELKNLQSLNLWNNKLLELPKEIGELKSLQSLNLINNKLLELPKEIRELKSLQSLNLFNNKLLELPKEIGELKSLQSLNLWNNKLLELPKEIGELKSLQSLSLIYNQLSEIPKEIGELKSLRKLELRNNQLSELPKEIGELKSLRKLELWNNQLSKLPKEIGVLKSLPILELWNNQLSELPKEIGELKSLRKLELTNNKLSKLPKEICELKSLQLLDLGSNKLLELPKEIGALKSLPILDLCNNQLSELPKEIGELKSLRKLELTNNILSKLPKEICELKSLWKLNLGSNQLSELPKEIGKLKSLQLLDLWSNKLSNLPKEIGELKSLQLLDLRYNNLKELPKEINALELKIQSDRYCGDEYYSGIILTGNPLETPPIEVIKKGNKAVINYFRQIDEKGKEYLYEAKFLIVGEPGAGKTTLAKKIIDSNYELKESDPSTEGIDVFRWQFEMENGQTFFMNIWDFGGQEIYHATHQFFLTKRSLYAVVADARKEDSDFNYWLNIVSLLSDNSPLLIIKNEKHDRMPDINERELKGRFTHLKEIYPSNFATNRGFSDIVKAIKHYISTLPHIGSPLPKTWMNVRKALESDSRNYISLDEYFIICDKHGLEVYIDKLQLSGYLHDLGVCLHFQDDAILKHRIFLKPEWGTEAVYKVLDHIPVIKNLGKFTSQDLSNIWHEKQYTGMQDELLQLMMKFQLCYEIPNKKGNYIAPQLLSNNKPEYDWDDTNNMFLRYSYDFMPKGIISRLIVIMNEDFHKHQYVWRKGVILSKYKTKAEIIENYNDRKIIIRVSGLDKKGLISIIMHEIDKIHASYKGLKFDKLIPCNCKECTKSQEPYFYKYSSLKKRVEKRKSEIECDKSFEMVNVKGLIDDISYGYDISEARKSIEPTPKNKVFISYSHNDEEWKDRLMKHLNILKMEDVIDVWEDRQIQAGDDWYEKITTALNQATVAVMLITADFLISDFIRRDELPLLLEKRKKDGLKIIPIIVKPFDFQSVNWLKKIQCVPKDATPLISYSEYEIDKTFAEITKIVRSNISGVQIGVGQTDCRFGSDQTNILNL